MTRLLTALLGSLLLAAPLLLIGCSDDDSSITEPLPPTSASIDAPVEGAVLLADEPVVLEGSGTMTTGEPVYPNYLVWYRGEAVEDSLIGTGTTQQVMLPAGEHTIVLVAHESINLSATTSVTFTVEDPENWPPVPEIKEPLDGETYLPAHVVTVLSGAATDVEDGDLTGDALNWYSTIDGDLGTGASLEAPLSPGDHLLILTATDSFGESIADTVAVTCRHRPAAPVVDGSFFFRANNFTELCGDKEVTQLIGDCIIDVDEGTGTAEIEITDMGGSIDCSVADICTLDGELVMGNIRTTATGATDGGGTLTLEISAYVSTPTTVEGLIRAIETSAGGETCVYRGPIWMTINTR